eukprot:GGOE01005471.1.p1 GENE.GGOE01005471.1~~GGOE01005471.1.p1  ORF type:complete len:261 (-),score=23.95 GGOE01005471.1:93-875(-)
MAFRQSYILQCQSMPLFVILLVGGYFYFCNLVYIPLLAHYKSRHWAVAMYLFCILDSFLTLTSYLQAVLVDPGPVPPDWNSGRKRVPFCGRCNEFKPLRTHHCSHCQRCVLRYDHHCDWIDNCVGHVNHKLFFLWLFYINLAIVHYHYLAITLVVHAELVLVPESAPYFLLVNLLAGGIFTLLIFPLSFLGLSFLLWTTYLLATNQTSLESGLHESYDAGLLRNVCEVLGDSNPISHTLPFPLQRPLQLCHWGVRDVQCK